MSDHEDVFLDDVDPMLFLATYIEDQLDLIDKISDTSGFMFGIGDLVDGVADVAREQIAEAQAGLDLLIERDTTWRPA